MKINPNGFREYDARWLFEKDIDLEGITDLGKGLGSQIIKQTNSVNKQNDVRNPNWQEADQLAIYTKRGVKFRSTEYRPNHWQGGGFEPGTPGL